MALDSVGMLRVTAVLFCSDTKLLKMEPWYWTRLWCEDRGDQEHFFAVILSFD
jgi:hypothetical protein